MTDPQTPEKRDERLMAALTEAREIDSRVIEVAITVTERNRLVALLAEVTRLTQEREEAGTAYMEIAAKWAKAEADLLVCQQERDELAAMHARQIDAIQQQQAASTALQHGIAEVAAAIREAAEYKYELEWADTLSRLIAPKDEP